MNFMQTKNNSKKGFTLLELLIVIAIIAILATVVVLVLNPAETLRKTRDAQRISDLATIKTALGLYLSSETSPQLDGISGTANDKCLDGAGTKTIFYSVPVDSEDITDAAYAPTGFTSYNQVLTTADNSKVDGNGWVPINVAGLVGGSPISNFPIDPTNLIVTGTSALAVLTNDSLAYRYACDSSPLSFEINAKLESEFYTSTDNKAAKDGGNNTNLYEVGTSLTVLPSTNDF